MKKYKYMQNEFDNIKDIIKKRQIIKPPTYEWQELALKIIKELNIPNFKKNSVFKICKEKSKNFIENCLNDTKELCKTNQKWRYFFKIVSKK